MHKDTVKAIESVLKRFTDNNSILIFIDDKESGGFWKMTITFSPKRLNMVNLVKKLCESIGDLHGEQIGLSMWNNVLILG